MFKKNESIVGPYSLPGTHLRKCVKSHVKKGNFISGYTGTQKLGQNLTRRHHRVWVTDFNESR